MDHGGVVRTPKESDWLSVKTSRPEKPRDWSRGRRRGTSGLRRCGPIHRSSRNNGTYGTLTSPGANGGVINGPSGISHLKRDKYRLPNKPPGRNILTETN